MGGRGSGGRNRLSDEEKKRRGTFRPDNSDAVYDQRAAARVIAGPWLSSIPDPEYPLNEIGMAKYRELTEPLFRDNKLTAVTVMRASTAALLHQKFHAYALAGKPISGSDVAQMRGILADLDIANSAPPIADPNGKRNKFAQAGFASRRTAQVTLRPSSAAGPKR